MSHYQPISDVSAFNGVVLSRFDVVIEWLLVSLLAFMPLAFGVVHAWSEEVVIVLSAAIAFCFALKLLYHREAGIIWNAAYIPIAVFLFISVIQLIPLPTAVVHIISPNTVSIKKELLSDLPNTTVPLESLSLTFYPYATKHDLRLVLSLAMVFVVVFNVFRRPEQIKRLLMSVAIIGGAVALITLAQNIFGNGKIYWFVPTRSGNGYSGPFVNHSNYGQFMNLSIGAALAYLCVKLHEGFAHKKVSPAGVLEWLFSASAKTFWLLLAIICLAMATVFITLTRGGMISMLIAFAFTTLSLSWRRSLRGHGWIMVVMAIVAFTCILYAGFDAVYARLATLRNFHEAQSGRLQILKDIAVMWTRFPILGTGLGTHSVVYPMFDRSNLTALAAHAENEYAQVLEETGLTGLGLLIIFGFIIWSKYSKNIRNISVPICSAAYGLGFGLLAMLIHSLSDFGQHLPANAFLSAIFCAIVLTLAQQREKQKDVPLSAIYPGKYKGLYSIILLVCAGIWAWTFVDANNARLAEACWKKAVCESENLSAKNWQAAETEYADLISNATAAVKYDPENIQYLYWLNVYKWRSISQRIDPDTRQVIISDEALPAVHNIVEQFHKACVLCPTYGQAYSVVGQIEKLVLNDINGVKNINKGFRLAPCDPMACFAAGYVDILDGRNQDCITKFERTVQLDASRFNDVAYIYIHNLSRPDLAISAAGDDIERLKQVVSILDEMQYTDLAEQTIKKLEKLLKAQCAATNASAYAFQSLAKIYMRQHDNLAAIECFRQALAADYSQVYWRLELAKLLAETQQIPEAIREARICLRLRPGFKASAELLEQLCVSPAAFSEQVRRP